MKKLTALLSLGTCIACQQHESGAQAPQVQDQQAARTQALDQSASASQRSLTPPANATGLVTTSTVPYKLNTGYAGRPFVEKLSGTVVLGAKCGASGTGAAYANTIQVLVGNDAKEYRIISDKTKVTMSPPTATKPTTIYGLCGTTPPTPQPSYTNLPVVCPDLSAENQLLAACPWEIQKFEVGSATALVRACPVAPCSATNSYWRKLGGVPATTLVEVCTASRQAGTSATSGECKGTTTTTWGAMKYIAPNQVRGYAPLPNEPTNAPPTISGTPPPSVVAGTQYTFTPTATDPENAPLAFAIANKPAWATFIASSGRLTGTPTTAGLTTDIRITVTDSVNTVALAPFTITVTSPSPKPAAVLTWVPPTKNTDGSALTNLTGYRIYYGMQLGLYTQSIPINGAASTYTILTLPPGTYYFTLAAVNSTGQESAKSNDVEKVVP